VAPSITYENVENALFHCLYENESKKKKKLETISAICDNFDPLTDSSSYHTMAVLQNVNRSNLVSTSFISVTSKGGKSCHEKKLLRCLLAKITDEKNMSAYHEYSLI